MNTKTMEGLVGAGTNMKLMDTPMRVFKQARSRGDTATMERAMKYAGEFSGRAEEYKEKADKGMEEETKETREKEKTQREEALRKRREEREKTGGTTPENGNADNSTDSKETACVVEISEEGKELLKDHADLTSFVQSFCLFLVVLFMTGCGGAHSGSSEGARAVSGPAVSGQAVSGSSVSGQAVSGSKGAGRYTYCSDRNLYYIREPYSDEARLVERDLESGAEREIPVDHIHEVCYADNDWVYYAKRTEVEQDGNCHTIVGEFCRSPIDKDSFRMDEKAEELVLKEDSGAGMVLSIGHVGIDYQGIQCDGRYVVYQSGEWTKPRTLETFLRVYDIRNGSDNIFSEEEFDVSDVTLCGGSLFLYDESREELVRVKLETGEKLTVAPSENYNPDDSVSAVSDEAVFWKHDDGDKWEIWQYGMEEQKSFRLIAEEEFRDLLGQRGLLDCSVGGTEHVLSCEGCFARAGRLYVQIGIEGEGSGGIHCRNCVILSKETGRADAALVYEEELNRCLANPEGRQKVFTKKHDGIYGRQPYQEKTYFMSRGFCVSMTEEECLLYLENEDEKKNMPARYDFGTGSMEFLNKDDEWLPKHLYAANNRILTGDSGRFMEPYNTCDKMPNNYD